jgi:hypothetical protein
VETLLCIIINTTTPSLSLTDQTMAINPLEAKYVHGVYIPSALLVFGTFIVKKEWLPYAVGLALMLGSYRFYSSRMSIEQTPRHLVKWLIN